jgi:DNA repair exonuclease SbcCD ATPase subunit
MTDTTSLETPATGHGGDEPSPAAKPGRRWPKRAGSIALAVVVLLVGVLIGSSANNKSGELATAKTTNASLRTQVSRLNGQVQSLKGQVQTLNGRVATAQSTAQNATSAANSKAAQAYAARNAALSQQSSALKQQQTALSKQQQQVKAQLGQIQASQLSGDGVYVVGQDIKPGVYHTNGSGDTGANDCYFATLNSSDTNDIADNNNFDGAETVDVSSAYAFEINGPCTWSRISG